jgi:hypothetical protein
MKIYYQNTKKKKTLKIRGMKRRKIKLNMNLRAIESNVDYTKHKMEKLLTQM